MTITSSTTGLHKSLKPVSFQIAKFELNINFVSKVVGVVNKSLEFIKIFHDSVPSAYTNATKHLALTTQLLDGTRFFGKFYGLLKPNAFKGNSVWKPSNIVLGVANSFFSTILLGDFLKLYNLNKLTNLKNAAFCLKTITKVGSLISSVLSIADGVSQYRINRIELKNLSNNPKLNVKEKIEKLKTEAKWILSDCFSFILKITSVALVLLLPSTLLLSAPIFILLAIIGLYNQFYIILKDLIEVKSTEYCP